MADTLLDRCGWWSTRQGLGLGGTVTAGEHAGNGVVVCWRTFNKMLGTAIAVGGAGRHWEKWRAAALLLRELGYRRRCGGNGTVVGVASGSRILRWVSVVMDDTVSVVIEVPFVTHGASWLYEGQL